MLVNLEAAVHSARARKSLDFLGYCERSTYGFFAKLNMVRGVALTGRLDLKLSLWSNKGT